MGSLPWVGMGGQFGLGMNVKVFMRTSGAGEAAVETAGGAGKELKRHYIEPARLQHNYYTNIQIMVKTEWE